MAARRARPAAGRRTGAHLGGGSAVGRRPAGHRPVGHRPVDHRPVDHRPADGRAGRAGRPHRPRRRRGGAAAGAAGRDPLPSLLGRAAGPGRPGGVREPRHLPADRGSPHYRAHYRARYWAHPGSVPAGVRPRPLFRRHRHRRGGRARIRGRAARQPLGRPAHPDRGPVRPASPPREPGHKHPDAPAGPGERAGVVPAALAGSGQGRPRGRPVPGDSGGRLPAVRRGRMERAPGFLAVAVHDPGVRRGTPGSLGGVRQRGRPG